MSYFLKHLKQVLFVVFGTLSTATSFYQKNLHSSFQVAFFKSRMLNRTDGKLNG